MLPELPPIPVSAWLAAHWVHTSRRVRTVFDSIVEQLGPSKRFASLSGRTSLSAHTKRALEPR